MKKGQLLLLFLVSVIVLSIITPLIFHQHNDTQTTVSRELSDSTRSLSQWEYAWSEYNALVEDETQVDGRWEKTDCLLNPPGREGRRILWMRTQLPENLGYDPTLLVQASQLFEVYLDGELLSRHGRLEGAHPRYIGTPPRIFGLPDDAGGKLLTVRIYSYGKDIGLLQTPIMASRSDLVLLLIKNQGLRFIVGSFYLMIGLISYLSGLRIRENYMFSFGGFACAFGLYNVSRTMLVLTLIDSPEFWMLFELAFLVLSMAAVLTFTEQLFPGSWKIKLRLSRLHILLGAAGLPFVAVHLLDGTVFLLLYQILLLASIIITVVRIGRIAWRKDRDAAQVLVGLAVFCAFGAGDIIRQMLMLDNPLPELSHWGSLAFLTSLIVVILRRIHNILFRLSNTEKLSVAGQMAAGVVHEIRNPVTVISGYLQLMKKGTQVNHVPMIDLMLGEVNRINLLVNEFLFLARPSSPKFALKSICGIVSDNLRLFESQATGAGVELEYHCHPNLPLISCDENQIKQVLVNVIKNGLEAMPDGGKLEVSVEHDAPYIRIRVSDTGCGIESQDLKMIGEPFFTTKESGNGLGIMICRRIVDTHKGVFNIVSQPGQGTTVEIFLPVDPQTT